MCLRLPKTHACIPCGHKCVCDKCAVIIMNNQDNTNKKCPICRANVNCIIRIYDDEYLIKSYCDHLVADIVELKEKLAESEKINIEGLEKRAVKADNLSLDKLGQVEGGKARYIPPQYVGYEDPWQRIGIDKCKACRRSKKGICYTHLYVTGAPVE